MWLKNIMTKVVKLAQLGYDVKTAGDENLIYSSKWPLLKIYKQGSFTTSNNTNNTSHIVSHDLGFVPAYAYFANLTITSWSGSTFTVDDSRSEFNMGVDGFIPGVSDKELVFDINPGGFSTTTKFYYYIYALDITKPYTAPITNIGTTSQTKGSKIFKLAKPGKSIDSDSLEDYSIHSDTRSPLIHAVYPGTTSPDGSAGGYGFTFYHNLGYAPMFFAYGKTGSAIGTTHPTPNSWESLNVAGATSGFIVDEKKISFTNPNANMQVSLVILKDPFETDYQVNVNV